MANATFVCSLADHFRPTSYNRQHDSRLLNKRLFATDRKSCLILSLLVRRSLARNGREVGNKFSLSPSSVACFWPFLIMGINLAGRRVIVSDFRLFWEVATGMSIYSQQSGHVIHGDDKEERCGNND